MRATSAPGSTAIFSRWPARSTRAPTKSSATSSPSACSACRGRAMDFTFTDEQRMITDTVRELLADRCTGADLRRLMDSGDARDDGRWSAIVEMGLTGLLVPEDAG